MSFRGHRILASYFVISWSAAGLVFGQPTPGSEVRVRLSSALEIETEETPEAPTAVLRAESTRDTQAGSTPAPIKKTLQIPGEARFELTPGETFFLKPESDHFWMPTATILTTSGRQQLNLNAWPTGQLEGKVSFPNDENPLPTAWTIVFESAPDAAPGEAVERSSISCPIDEGKWRCELPAVALDLKLKAKGYIPHYRWGLKLRPGKTLELGTLELRPGSALSGRIEINGIPAPGTEARVELRPIETAPRSADEDEGTRRRRALRAWSETPNSRGFFFFPDLPPGAYEAIARHPGFAEARSGPLTIVEGAETELIEPLVLAPPSHLEIFIDPTTDPWDQPWQLTLSRLGVRPHPEILERATADLGGAWASAELPPGDYLVEIGAEGKGAWHSERVGLKGPSTLLQIEIAALRVLGEIRLGDEPLPAELHFTNGSAAVRMESDEEGLFEGILTGDGPWKITVIARSIFLMKRLVGVEVRRRAGSDEAELTLELADNRLSGRVVDERRQGVRASVIGVGLGADGLRSTPADEDGHFEFRALDQGFFQLSASTADNRVSDQVGVEIVEELEPSEIELVVRPKLEIRGQLVSQGAGVPEARILAWPSHEPLSAGNPVATDAEGRFTLQLSDKTREISINILARGFALRMLTLPAAPGRPLIIPLHQNGGRIHLTFAESPDADYRSGTSHVLLHGRSWLGLDSLAQWARLVGGGWSEETVLTIPDLEPGAYRFCSVETPRLLAAVAGAGPPERCAAGTLSPGGELTLEVPRAPEP